MSGPIIRKYGFPNHDQIFGKRDLDHGADESAKPKPKPDTEAKAKDDKAAPTDAPKSKESK